MNWGRVVIGDLPENGFGWFTPKTWSFGRRHCVVGSPFQWPTCQEVRRNHPGSHDEVGRDLVSYVGRLRSTQAKVRWGIISLPLFPTIEYHLRSGLGISVGPSRVPLSISCWFRTPSSVPCDQWTRVGPWCHLPSDTIRILTFCLSIVSYFNPPELTITVFLFSVYFCSSGSFLSDLNSLLGPLLTSLQEKPPVSNSEDQWGTTMISWEKDPLCSLLHPGL